MDTAFKFKLTDRNFFFTLTNIKYNPILKECSTIAALFFPNQELWLDSEIIIKYFINLKINKVNIIFITSDEHLLNKEKKKTSFIW